MFIKYILLVNTTETMNNIILLIINQIIENLISETSSNVIFVCYNYLYDNTYVKLQYFMIICVVAIIPIQKMIFNYVTCITPFFITLCIEL